MSRSSASSTDTRSDTEERPGSHAAFERGDTDQEKQSPSGCEALAKTRTRDLNSQALPGVQLDEDGHHGAADPAEAWKTDDTLRRDEGGRDGIAGVIERVISRTSTKSNWNPGPPPDGGKKAWMAVAAGHLVIMNTWGYINSFGLFQAYYSSALNLPPSTIAWIGSIQVFLIFFIGTFTGRLTDAGYFRPVFFLGTCFQMLGIFTNSVCTEYWQLFLAQGVCMGIGSGCLFCPAMATVSTYFSTKRGIAIGMTACGSATGGLVFPAMARQLLPTVGFGWTVRAIGFVQLVGLVLANLGLKTRVPPRRSGALVEWAAFKELEYTFYAAGSFMCFLGVYFAFYYIASFSRDIIGFSYTDSLNLLLLLNGIGIIGRLVPNYLADRYGAINVFIPTALIAGICQLTWIAVSNPNGLYAWTVFFGMAAGGIQSLFPAGLSSLTTDLRKAGTRMGMVFTISSFATLTGPPIAGALITRCGGAYYGAQAFAGGVILCGACFMLAARIVRTRRMGVGLRIKV